MALQARNVVTRDHLARKSGAEPTQELLQAHETDPKHLQPHRRMLLILPPLRFLLSTRCLLLGPLPLARVSMQRSLPLPLVSLLPPLLLEQVVLALQCLQFLGQLLVPSDMRSKIAIVKDLP